MKFQFPIQLHTLSRVAQLCAVDSFLHPRIVYELSVWDHFRVRYNVEDNFLMEKPTKHERTKQRRRWRKQLPEEQYADSDAD